MDTCYNERKLLAENFKASRLVLKALGDDNRQLIFLTLLEADHEGMRVPELMKRTHLSRAALSHHLRILKEADLVELRRIGTKNYYYAATAEERWASLHTLTGQVLAAVRAARKHGCPHIKEE
ncbi:MAG: winged helix-turn-helix domain-containing protein [Peptococcaceae bacterium]|nr:winged helix-turn-helix domain-containing protein [Peptococcaceae bacterium]